MYFSILTCDRFAFNLQQHPGGKQSNNGISDRIHPPPMTSFAATTQTARYSE
ncbi:hypothetical protein NDI49_09720 [Trichocoleus sp. ST-U3]